MFAADNAQFCQQCNLYCTSRLMQYIILVTLCGLCVLCYAENSCAENYVRIFDGIFDIHRARKQAPLSAEFRQNIRSEISSLYTGMLTVST